MRQRKCPKTGDDCIELNTIYKMLKETRGKMYDDLIGRGVELINPKEHHGPLHLWEKSKELWMGTGE